VRATSQRTPSVLMTRAAQGDATEEEELDYDDEPMDEQGGEAEDEDLELLLAEPAADPAADPAAAGPSQPSRPAVPSPPPAVRTPAANAGAATSGGNRRQGPQQEPAQQRQDALDLSHIQDAKRRALLQQNAGPMLAAHKADHREGFLRRGRVLYPDMPKGTGPCQHPGCRQRQHHSTENCYLRHLQREISGTPSSPPHEDDRDRSRERSRERQRRSSRERSRERQRRSSRERRPPTPPPRYRDRSPPRECQQHARGHPWGQAPPGRGPPVLTQAAGSASVFGRLQAYQHGTQQRTLLSFAQDLSAAPVITVGSKPSMDRELERRTPPHVAFDTGCSFLGAVDHAWVEHARVPFVREPMPVQVAGSSTYAVGYVPNGAISLFDGRRPHDFYGDLLVFSNLPAAVVIGRAFLDATNGRITCGPHALVELLPPGANQWVTRPLHSYEATRPTLMLMETPQPSVSPSQRRATPARSTDPWVTSLAVTPQHLAAQQWAADIPLPPDAGEGLDAGEEDDDPPGMADEIEALRQHQEPWDSLAWKRSWERTLARRLKRRHLKKLRKEKLRQSAAKEAAAAQAARLRKEAVSSYKKKLRALRAGLPLSQERQEEQRDETGGYYWCNRPDITPQQRQQLQELVRANDQVFARSLKELGCYNGECG
ncbi:hypothetical protein Agub_g15662, partial [Astrephomene gubernaculifera]